MSGFFIPAASKISTTSSATIASDSICLMAVSISSSLFVLVLWVTFTILALIA
jgi:hypothetical protein